MPNPAIIISLVFAAATLAPGSDEILTQDFSACAAADDTAICLLQQMQRSPYARPLSEDPAFAGASAIVQLVEAGTVPLAENDGDRRFRSLQLEPARLTGEALDRVYEQISHGASVEDSLRPVRETARDRDAVELMNGQIHINSGAEIRAAAYRRLSLMFTASAEGEQTVPRALALAAVQAWEAELADGRSISTYHNPELGLSGIIAAYTALRDEAGLRRTMTLEKGGALGLDDEIGLLYRLGRDADAISLLAGFTPRGRRQADERRRAEQLVVGNAMRSPNADARTYAVEFFLQNCAEADPPDNARITTMMAGRPRQETEALAACFSERASNFDETGAKFARLAFDLWESLDDTERANSLMQIWHSYAVEEDELHACPGVRWLCAKPFYQYTLGRRDRVREGFESPSFTAIQALPFDLANGRGLIHLQEYEAQRYRPGLEPLRYSLHRAKRSRPPDRRGLRPRLDRALRPARPNRSRMAHHAHRPDHDPERGIGPLPRRDNGATSRFGRRRGWQHAAVRRHDGHGARDLGTPA